MSSAYMSRTDGGARLHRDPRRGWIAGVCAGLAQSLGVTPCFMRCLALVALLFANLWAVAAYVVAAILLPKRDGPAGAAGAPDSGACRDRVDPEAETRYARAAEADLQRLRDRFRGMEDRLRGMEAHVTSRERNLDEELRRL